MDEEESRAILNTVEPKKPKYRIQPTQSFQFEVVEIGYDGKADSFRGFADGVEEAYKLIDHLRQEAIEVL